MIAFGPIPSRRLGQSLGINHITPKCCAYDCIYCQAGRNASKDIERRPFLEPEVVLEAVRTRVREVRAGGGRIDYLSLVPDGEPTLDINLGRIIELLREFDIPVAVITNSALLWRADVRAELAGADCVSLKMDAVTEKPWRRINRPNHHLSLPQLLDGALAFAAGFKGRLLTDTMLIEGANNAPEDLLHTAQYLAKLHPAMAYLALPTRPPLEAWATAPSAQNLQMAYRIFSAHLKNVAFLSGFSPEPFAAAGNIVQALLDITQVHPMRESEVLDLFDRSGTDHAVLQTLVAEGRITRMLHDGKVFYAGKQRKVPTPQ